jgi:hypothetical protein
MAQLKIKMSWEVQDKVYVFGLAQMLINFVQKQQKDLGARFQISLKGEHLFIKSAEEKLRLLAPKIETFIAEYAQQMVINAQEAVIEINPDAV